MGVGVEGWIRGEPYPDHIDSDQHIDGVVAGDALEHAVGGVVAGFPGHIWEWHFVHTERALGQGRGLRSGWHSKQSTAQRDGTPPPIRVDGSEGVQGFRREWPGQ